MAFAKYSNGRLFRFLTGSPDRIDKQHSVYLWILCKTHLQSKNCSNHTGCCSRFSTTKTTESVLADSCVSPHLSSSPDLRIFNSHTAFSAFANDRLSSNVRSTRIQWRYRPGFSPGFLFSCGAVTTSASTQEEIYFSRL